MFSYGVREETPLKGLMETVKSDYSELDDSPAERSGLEKFSFLDVVTDQILLNARELRFYRGLIVFTMGQLSAREMRDLSEKIEETKNDIKRKGLVPFTYSRSRNLDPEEFKGTEPYTVYSHHRFRTDKKGDFKDMVELVLDGLKEEDVIVVYNNKFV